jgi:phospholipid transport system substrate-binding protein
MFRLWRCLLVLAVTGSVICQAAFAAPSPMEQVKTTVDQVINVLRDTSLAGEARRQILSKVIRARFNFNIMAQRTLGKYWKSATTDEQERFVSLFSDLLEASYIGRIESYSDEVINYMGERLVGDRAEVTTSVRSGGSDIPIDYRLVLIGEEWYVYDVIIEDVSLVKNYRSSYGEIVRNEGFAGLFTRMETKIQELRAAPPVKKS